MFSVVIPLFNKEKTIDRTIKSVLNQSYGNFELIVVNDGSTDNSLSIVRLINDRRIKIIDKKNGGESSSRNAGILASQYKYIAFLDADDYWAPKYLETMIELIMDYPLASFYGSQFLSVNCATQKIVNEKHSIRGYVENYYKKQMIAPLVCSSNIIVKKECFEQIGYFNTIFKRGGDLEMWARLADNFKLAFEPVPLSYYVLDAENRACNNIPPLDNFYLEFKLSNKAFIQKKYFLYLASSVVIEMILKKNYINAFKILFRYNLYTIIIIFFIIKKIFTTKREKLFKSNQQNELC
ncbi:MAG: glycosyltransferase family 2 protein [Melioribacter sp.]|nr:glycosyltransferase family 2 protein [Melioribacter sp.]